MTKIFISYRRDDSQYVTDSIYDHMVRHFGKENVFLDVGSIPFGVDFRQYLSDQIARNNVVLVIIGQDWARMMKERASQTNDFVRIEIENALTQGKLLIPVLVKNAMMPDFSDLPESIQDLQWRNSATIRRQPDFESDCTTLANSIKQLGKTRSTSELMPKPFEWIDIPDKGYSISKYPITNSQFSMFIEAEGYKLEHLWIEQGWNECQLRGWSQPRHWNDSNWNSSEKPVVGISWYETVAFCSWLVRETAEKIFLPTSEQWLYAAQGMNSRTYPWGDEWRCDYCNNSVEPCTSQMTTPVTYYEGNGDSLFGVADMAGNIWEWCLTTDIGVINSENKFAHNILHGGCWRDTDPKDFRCNDFMSWDAHGWSTRFGFRIVRLD